MGEKTNGRFTDGKGDTWTIKINFGSIRRVKTGCGADLMHAIPRAKDENDTGENPLIAELDFDLVLFVDVLYWILHPDLEDKEVTAREFGEERITPLVYTTAAKAFWEVYADFFLSIGWNHVAEAIQKQQEVMPEIRHKAVSRFGEAAELTLKAFDANSEKVMAKLRQEAEAEAEAG